MLKTRMVTALALLGLFLFALICLPLLGWAVFASLIVALAAWEWGGLLLWPPQKRFFLGGGFFLVCLLIFFTQPRAFGLLIGFDKRAWQLGRWFYIPAAVFWIVGAPLWMRQRWVLPRSEKGVLIGALVLLPAWLALIQLRHIGWLTLLVVMALVWLVDSVAYFTGRAWGRNKLAPAISPGKTWEGAIGGGLAVVICGVALAGYLPARIAGNPILLILLLLGLAAISIIGDLFESMLKRQAGLKDSSNLLPGHGGILDRIDSLTSTLPVVALVWLLLA